MGLQERAELYRILEEKRGKPLIVYVTSSRANASGAMAGDFVPELLAQLTALPADVDDLDILIASQGGDPTVAWRTVSLIRERVSKFSVLVPQAAFSAATLLALGADEIVMHPHGNLGPVDPQITVQKQNGEGGQTGTIRFGSEDLSALIDFAKEEVGLRDQAQLVEVFQLVCKEVGSVPLGVAKRSAQLSMTMGERLLGTHMKGDGEQEKARGIAQALNKNYFHHGYPVSRTEAKDQLGLKIADRDAELEDLLWKIWIDIEQEMQMREPFNPIAVLKADPNCAALFEPTLQISIPLNLPPAVLQPIIQQVANSLQVTQVPPADYALIHAACESARWATRCVQTGKILASRLPDLQIRVNMMVEQQQWVNVALPHPPASNGGST